jgi:enediyne biosynthesis protein E5
MLVFEETKTTTYSAPSMRIRALRRFAFAISILTLLGHTVLGFEQSYAQPVFSLLTTYSIELLLESVSSWAQHKKPAFLARGFVGFIDFLLPAHITGLAIGMLLYASDRILPFVFAATIAICSKAVFRVPTEQGARHFLNPSNAGITITLLLFHSVGIAPPYMFTEGLGRILSVLLPLLIITIGSFLNAKLTRRMPLICAWLGGFAIQALVRGLMGASILSILNAMTGVAFVLFTFYMLTDPATTPSKFQRQIIFGLGVSFTYGLLVIFHIVFGLFFALSLVCLVRGLLMSFEYAFAHTRSSAHHYPYMGEKEQGVRRAEDSLFTGVIEAPGRSGGRG